MPKLKNIDKLVRRAVQHKAQDEITRMTYGKIMGENGDAKFEGCAIGCLATPNTIKEIVADSRISKHVKVQGKFYSLDINITHEGDYISLNDTQRDILKSDFGICSWLACIAEFVFENLPEDLYENWPVEFANILTEGVKVTNKQIKKWADENGYTDALLRTASGNPRRTGLDNEDVEKMIDYIKEICSE